MAISAIHVWLSLLSICLIVLIWITWSNGGQSTANGSSIPVGTGQSSTPVEISKSTGMSLGSAHESSKAEADYADLQAELQATLVDLSLKYASLEKQLAEGQATSSVSVKDIQLKLQELIDQVKKDMEINLNTLSSNMLSAAADNSIAVDRAISTVKDEVDRISALANALDVMMSTAGADISRLDKFTQTLSSSLDLYRSASSDKLAAVESSIREMDKLKEAVPGMVAAIQTQLTSLESLGLDVKGIGEQVRDIEMVNLAADGKWTELKSELDELSSRVANARSDFVTGVQLATVLRPLNANIANFKTTLDGMSGFVHETILNFLAEYDDPNLAKVRKSLEDYITSQGLVMKEVSDGLSKLKEWMGDMTAYNNSSVVDTFKTVNAAIAKMDVDTTDLKAKVNELANIQAELGDVDKVRKGFVSYTSAIKMLRSADKIMSAHRLRQESSAQWATPILKKYREDLDRLEGMDTRIAPSMLLTVITNMESYRQYLEFDNAREDNIAVSDFLTTAKSIVDETSKIKTISDYLANIQLAVGGLTASGNVTKTSIAAISTTLSALQTVVGDMESPGAGSLAESIKSLTAAVADLKGVDASTATTLASLKTKQSTTEEKLAEVSSKLEASASTLQKLAGTADSINYLQSEITLLMDRTGVPGAIYGKNLSAAVENIWAELNTWRTNVGNFTQDIRNLKEIMGILAVKQNGQTVSVQEALESMSGNVVNTLAELSDNQQRQSAAFGRYSKDEFNQRTLVDTIKDIDKRLASTESSALSQATSVTKLTNALGDISALKIALSGFDAAPPYTTNGLLTRVSKLEASVLDHLDKINESTRLIDQLTTSSNSVSGIVTSMLPFFQKYKDIMGEVPSRYKTFGDAVSGTIIDATYASNTASKAMQDVVSMRDDIASKGAAIIANSDAIADLKAKAANALSQQTTLGLALTSTDDSLKNVIGAVDTIQQRSFVKDLSIALDGLIRGYDSMYWFVDQYAPSAKPAIALARDVQALLPGFVEWSANPVLATKLVEMHKLLSDTFSRLGASIKAGETIETVNTPIINTHVKNLWLAWGEPFDRYSAVSKAWLDKSPLWLQLPGLSSRVKSTEDIVSGLSANTKVILDRLGSFADSDPTIKKTLDGIVDSIKLIGTWTPTTVDPTLVSAISRVSSKAIVSESDILSLKTIIGSFTSTDVSIKTALDDINAAISKLQSNSADKNSVDMLSQSLEKILLVVGSYNGNIGSDIARINRSINLLGDLSTLPSSATVASELTALKTSIADIGDKIAPVMIENMAWSINRLREVATEITALSYYDRTQSAQISDMVYNIDGLSLDAIKTWSLRQANTSVTKYMLSLKTAYDKSGRSALDHFSSYASLKGVSLIITYLDKWLPFILGTANNKSVDVTLIDMQATSEALAKRIASLETGSGSSRISTDMASLKKLSGRVQTAMTGMDMQTYNWQLKAMVANLVRLDGLVDGFHNGMVGDDLLDAISTSVKELSSIGSTIMPLPTQYAYVQAAIDEFKALGKTLVGDGSIYWRVKGLTKSIGTYSGVASISIDLAKAIVDISTIQTSIYAMQTTSTNIDTRLTTAEATLKNLIAEKAATNTASAGGIAMKSPDIVIPKDTRTSVVAVFTITDGVIVSESYPPGYTLVKYQNASNAISVNRVIELARLDPNNIGCSYFAMYASPMKYRPYTATGSNEIYHYVAHSKGNTKYVRYDEASSITTAYGTSIQAPVASKQVTMQGPDLIRFINSAVMATLKNKPNATVFAEMQIWLANPTTSKIAAGATIPSVSAEWRVSPVESSIDGIPVIEPTGVLNLQQYGIIMPNITAPVKPITWTTSTSTSTTTEQTCPYNSYMCGMLTNPNGSNTIRCCAFSTLDPPSKIGPGYTSNV